LADSQNLSCGPPPYRPNNTVIESEQAWIASAKHSGTQCTLRNACSLINYTASTLGPPQPNPPYDLDRASMPLCLGCSSAVPRVSPTNLNPQVTGFPNATNQTMIDMVDHWLYSWSRHRSLQWTDRSKNNRRNSPLTVISKSVLNFNGTSLPTILPITETHVRRQEALKSGRGFGINHHCPYCFNHH